ncbi:MAG: TerC family protein [Elusimicrobia bacterium]|nr:TerC family protein [Elusimicrobiota bacterium]
MLGETGLWLLFSVIMSVVLCIDLGIMQKKAHVVSFQEALFWTLAWSLLAFGFAGVIALSSGRERAMQFIAGFLLEKSLSADNMFVFILIFSYFGIPPLYQSRILHWGILGAIAMRFLLIFAGVALINTFHWMIYVFGAVLVYTGAKMAFQKEEAVDPGRNPALRLFKRFMPLTAGHDEQRFFVRIQGVLHATPLFATLLVVEFSDLVFAMDSIPAVIAITTDTLVVYTSNVFAIMGLRALFFLLASMMGMFRYLKFGISVILVFVGFKMMAGPFYHIPTSASLCVIAGILAASIAASLLDKEKTA